MVKTGYARVLHALHRAARPPPSRVQNRSRVVKLHEFIARSVLPHKFPLNSRKMWRGSLDPRGQIEGLSADSPQLGSLTKFVDQTEDKVSPQLFLQLRIMVLEVLIYARIRKVFEVVVNDKFAHQIKDKYRKWAASASTYDGTPAEVVEADPLAGTWAQHDRQPNLIVIKPELRRVPLPGEQRHLYPELLRQWWSKGLVEAEVIDTQGTRTRCQVWQLSSHLGNYRCDERYFEAETWALEAERLKIELCIALSQEQIDVLKKDLAEASGV